MATITGTNFADTLFGTAQPDLIYGYAGNDYLSAGGGSDDLYGGLGRDTLVGGTGDDWFLFGNADTGDAYAGTADEVWGFSEEDTIWLPGSHAYAGATDAPADGQYSVWQKDDAYVVTWNAYGDEGYNDILVYGANPIGNIDFF